MKLRGPLLQIFEVSLRVRWRFPGPFLVPALLREVLNRKVTT